MTRQKGKHKKRRPSWHQTLGTGRAWTRAAAMFDRTPPTGVDVTAAGPVRVLRGKQRNPKGETT